MRFVDEVTIRVQAGDGGRGCVSFRREKYVPWGGPDGGDGGKGANVYLEATERKQTLLDFHYRHVFKAPNGTHGRGKNRHGRGAEDLILEVPVGTMVKDPNSSEVVADLVRPGERWQAAEGGRGGQGNARFATATCRVPRFAQDGQPGEERDFRLELKLLADVGIVGVPNAGKSTLLSRVSAARPKIGDYPFTTLEPTLGVVLVDGQDIVLADIPGLIEGAHSGAGLGLSFLRHIERTRLLIHLLNGLSPDPVGDYDAINQELQLFNPQLAEKPQIVAFNKVDLSEVREEWPEVARALRARSVEALAVSAVSGEGVDTLLRLAAARLAELPAPLPLADVAPLAAVSPEADKSFTIEREPDGAWRVRGRRIERIVVMTQWGYYDAVMRFQRILEALGITQALRESGIEEGDTVRIGEKELEWSE
jgi:GTP-binding protein